MLANGGWDLILILLTWTIWRAPTNASKWRMGFNSAFKGLNKRLCVLHRRPGRCAEGEDQFPIPEIQSSFLHSSTRSLLAILTATCRNCGEV